MFSKNRSSSPENVLMNMIDDGILDIKLYIQGKICSKREDLKKEAISVYKMKLDSRDLEWIYLEGDLRKTFNIFYQLNGVCFDFFFWHESRKCVLYCDDSLSLSDKVKPFKIEEDTYLIRFNSLKMGLLHVGVRHWFQLAQIIGTYGLFQKLKLDEELFKTVTEELKIKCSRSFEQYNAAKTDLGKMNSKLDEVYECEANDPFMVRLNKIRPFDDAKNEAQKTLISVLKNLKEQENNIMTIKTVAPRLLVSMQKLLLQILQSFLQDFSPFTGNGNEDVMGNDAITVKLPLRDEQNAVVKNDKNKILIRSVTYCPASFEILTFFIRT